MARALVLNATYEPIGVVATRRAIVLSLTDKVDVLATGEKVFGSEHLQIPAPEVVRLRYYVKVPHERRAPLNRRTVFVRDDHSCQYCGRKAESLDHVVPRSRGGAHTWTNVVACCRSCNTSKGDRMLSDTGMRLRRRPAAPGGGLWLRADGLSVPDSWSDYIDQVRAA